MPDPRARREKIISKLSNWANLSLFLASRTPRLRLVAVACAAHLASRALILIARLLNG